MSCIRIYRGDRKVYKSELTTGTIWQLKTYFVKIMPFIVLMSFSIFSEMLIHLFGGQRKKSYALFLITQDFLISHSAAQRASLWK